MVFRRQTNKFAQTQNWLQNFSNLCIEKLLDIYFAITSQPLYKVEFQGFISRKLVPKKSKNSLVFYQIFQEKSFFNATLAKKKLYHPLEDGYQFQNVFFIPFEWLPLAREPFLGQKNWYGLTQQTAPDQQNMRDRATSGHR